MKKAYLSIAMAILMIVSVLAPLSYANATMEYTPLTTVQETSPRIFYEPVPAKELGPAMEKLDKALYDYYYVKQLGNRYGELFQRTYSTLSGKAIPYKAQGLLVKLDSMDSLGLLERIVDRFGGEIIKTFPEINTVLVAFPADPSVIGKAGLEIAKIPAVEEVSLDQVAQPAMWDTTVMLGTVRIWDVLGVNGSGVLVAVLDTGVDPTHPAIPPLANWSDFINGVATPYDDHGHGTHVSGTIVGNGPSIFNTTTGMWHSVLVGQTGQFNYVDYGNLTYNINLGAYAGGSIGLNVTHLYTLIDRSLLDVYNVSFAMGAYILYKFDNTNWTLLANFTGSNVTTPVTDSYTIDIPAGATSISISFIADYLAYYAPNGTLVLSHYDINGWFIDKIVLYNPLNTSEIIYIDDVSTLSPPLEVVSASWWIRTPSQFHGMAPGASLAVGKICGPTGCPYSAIISGMEWALNISADVVSMSIGGTATSYDPIAQMADYLVDNGIVVVIAAGNSGPDFYTVESPGISHKAITVGAATKAWTLAYFSSKGPSPVDFYVKPDVVAPGMAVSSSVNVTMALFGAEFPYEAWAGTSMATPHVSGLAALIKAAHPTWTPEMIKSAIISTADWLIPNAYTAYAYDVYEQGAGMIDPVQAITTTVLPIPANAFLGTPVLGVNNTVEFNITLVNLGPTAANVTVEIVDLYWTKANFTDPAYTDYDSLIISPTVGDSVIIPAGGTATVTIAINLTDPTLNVGAYGGHILFASNTTYETFKVIYGFTLLAPVWLNGTVYDYDTGLPLAGVNVTVWTPYLESMIASNITDSNGHFTIKVPSLTDMRIMVSESGYYLYISYAFNSDNGVVHDVYLKQYVTEPMILAFTDPSLPGNYTIALSAAMDAAAQVGMNLLFWDTSLLGTVYGPVLSGDFPIIFYTAGGYYYPIWDAADYTAIVIFSEYYPGMVILSGGDIGWFHEDDRLMYNVSHAVYNNDLWPDNYNITLLNSPITITALGWEVYDEYAGTPAGTPIGNVTTYYMPSYYPDIVNPVNGGVEIGNWTDFGNASIVAYYGGGVTAAMTVYFAFDVETLDYGLAVNLIRNAFATYLDTGAPQMVSDYIRTEIEAPQAVLYAGEAFSDDTGIAFYLLYLYNESMLVYKDGFTTGVITLNFDALGLPAGQTYYAVVIPVDYVGNLSFSLAIIHYLASTTGGAITFYGNATLPVPGFTETPITVEASVSDIVQVQVVQYASASDFPVTVPSTLPPYQLYLDFHVEELTPGATNYIIITIDLPENRVIVDPDATQILWWNGTQWLPFSNVTIDEETATISVYIDATTSPSIGDLAGTPIILATPPRLIGGELSLADGHAATPLMILAAALVLAGIGLARKKEN